ncbi:MAG: hypothetical protein ABFC77_13200 [Thermoguttaceae bacterium]
MPTFEGSVLRVYRLPILVEADNAEDARQKVEQTYRAMAADYDGGQDVFCDDVELPASRWPIEEIEEEPCGELQWSSWNI